MYQDHQIRCLSLAFIPHLVQDGDDRVSTPILVVLSCDHSPLVRVAATAAIGHVCPYGHQLAGQAVTALIKAIYLKMTNTLPSLQSTAKHCTYSSTQRHQDMEGDRGRRRRRNAPERP
jgi:hypothetical protein